MARIASSILANALVRRIHHEGGNAMVLAKGDPNAGALLLLCCERGENYYFVERGPGPDGGMVLVRSGPATQADLDIASYWQRRRSSDPDLWVIELDVADAERFAAETILAG